jgi:tRNA(Arg) A34 adenosine deaminase TadA
MTEREKKYMKLAIELAANNVSSGKGGPFGAVIVKNDEIIATAVNTVTSSNDPTAHAEVNAIREACKKLDSFQLDDCEIFSSCEPCPMCLGAIYWSRAKKLYFAASKDDAKEAGFDDSFIYSEIELPFNQRKLSTERLQTVDYKKPFKLWNATNSKIEY